MLCDSCGKPPWFGELYDETGNKERKSIQVPNEDPAQALAEAIEKAFIGE